MSIGGIKVTGGGGGGGVWGQAPELETKKEEQEI